MRPIVLLCFLGLLLLLIISPQEESSAPQMPIPESGISISSQNDGENRIARLKWFDLMHRRAPGLDWRKIEQQNRQEKLRNRPELKLRSECGTQSFLDNQMQASWQERGSDNQAGSVLDISYLTEKDEIWVISDGGSLLKRSRTINDWEIVNQDLRFNRGFLAFSEMEGGKRLLAFINNWLHYSDDFGQTWTAAHTDGPLEDYRGYSGLAVISQGEKSIIAFFTKASYYDNLQLMISLDGGQSVEQIEVMENFDLSDFKLLTVPKSDQLLLLERNANKLLEVKELDLEQAGLRQFQEEVEFSAGDGALEAQASLIEDGIQIHYLRFDEENSTTKIFSSLDLGKEWVEVGELPINPWPFTFYIDANNPQLMYVGEVEAFISRNAGQEWEKINSWYEYYDDVVGKLHADIMHVKSFKTALDTPFTLISNHGGISVSYDDFINQENLGLKDLNVSQYYSVRTSPSDPHVLFAGSQDQGLQAAWNVDRDSILSFDQVISGDYGHLAYTVNGQSLWAAYPGGSIYYVNDVYLPHQITSSFDLESEDEFIWIGPLVASPFLGENAVYIAGGNLDGGAGSHLVKLAYEDGEIVASQVDYDFKEEAIDGIISAIGMSEENPNYWYVATTNGRFFSSKDAGGTWNQTREFIPSGSYLYGQAIEISKDNPEHVYLAGSGYSNPGVFYSEDGGEVFVDKVEGLPPTLVYDLAFNDTESLLFAATEAGPYVFDVAQERWYDLASNCTPNQTYWSVEYVPEHNIARFGTYGRGIWDLRIEGLNLTNTTQVVEFDASKIYPNPSSSEFIIEMEKEARFELFGANGQFIESGQFTVGQNRVQIKKRVPGTYYLRIQSEDAIQVARLIYLQ